MASPDKHKVAAYLTGKENQALESLAERLSVSKSKVVAMAILAMADGGSSIQLSVPSHGGVVRAGLSEELEEIVEIKVKEQVEAAIANLTGEVKELSRKVEQELPCKP